MLLCVFNCFFVLDLLGCDPTISFSNFLPMVQEQCIVASVGMTCSVRKATQQIRISRYNTLSTRTG